MLDTKDPIICGRAASLGEEDAEVQQLQKKGDFASGVGDVADGGVGSADDELPHPPTELKLSALIADAYN